MASSVGKGKVVAREGKSVDLYDKERRSGNEVQSASSDSLGSRVPETGLPAFSDNTLARTASIGLNLGVATGGISLLSCSPTKHSLAVPVEIEGQLVAIPISFIAGTQCLRASWDCGKWRNVQHGLVLNKRGR
ncbi:UNVERIFIED_CONTAM: hypothetical protein Sangu_2614500 [Sesamum angustifolium]|uniref:Uncharacterized protein n=1 Tax=Sesamum angustifolium TaxID=2727405 RepID=A0AAW2J552_9LAMI